VLSRPFPHPSPIVGGIGNPASFSQRVEEQAGIGVEVDVQVPDDETCSGLVADESSHCLITATPRRAADDGRKMEELTRECEGEVTLTAVLLLSRIGQQLRYHTS